MGRFEVQFLVGISLLEKIDVDEVFESSEYNPALNEAVTNIIYQGPVFEHHPVGQRPLCADCRREADNGKS